MNFTQAPVARRLSAIWLIMLLGLGSPAWARESCFRDSTGPWRGPVADSGHLKVMDSEFHLDPQGHLAGSYHVHGALQYDGTLDGFRQTAPCEADFAWHDPFGTGIVHIIFDPDHGRFDGHWGIDAPDPRLYFNGRRTSPIPIS